MANLNSGGMGKKPLISRRFIVSVLAIAVVSFCAVLGSIFLKESLNQSATSNTAIRMRSAGGDENRPANAMGGFTSTPAKEKPVEEAGEKEVQGVEKP